jgi:hypothetical protein
MMVLYKEYFLIRSNLHWSPYDKYKALSGCLLSSLEKGKWNGKLRNRGVKKAWTNLNYRSFLKDFSKTNLPVYKLQMQPRI